MAAAQAGSRHAGQLSQVAGRPPGSALPWRARSPDLGWMVRLPVADVVPRWGAESELGSRGLSPFRMTETLCALTEPRTPGGAG